MTQVVTDNKNIKILLYLIIFFFVSTSHIHKDNNESKNFFSIKNIEIYGLNKENTEEINKDLLSFYGKNILFINSTSIKNILDKNNFIKNFVIKKHLPNTIIIEVEKAEIIGLILKKNNQYFLTNHKKLILKKNHNTDYKKLPVIYGIGAEKYFYDFNNMLKQNNFNLSLVNNYYYFQINRWDITLINGILIKLPINEVDEAIKTLNILINNPEFMNLKVIDLRIKNKLITQS